MDRHVEFATQLPHLVALYARDKVDHTAEKATLRAARAAAKHGAVDISLEDGQLRAGRQDASLDLPDVAALQAPLTTPGINRSRVPHHARPEDVKRLAKLLGAVASGRKSPVAFAGEVAAREWKELETARIPDAAVSAEPAAELAAEPATASAAVDTLLGPEHRELVERLITFSTPSALRRQFVVALRRLTKPTLVRAYAMLDAEARDGGAEVEQALARFGEDGADAVADRIGCVPTRALRAHYTELLGRLPGTHDALLALLDDQRESVIERAIELIVALRHPDTEHVLGEARTPAAMVALQNCWRTRSRRCARRLPASARAVGESFPGCQRPHTLQALNPWTRPC